MKKLGILGGTFNPIHMGHIELAECAYKSTLLDEVLFIPTGISYQKSTKNVLDSNIRLEMVHLAIENVSYFSCSDIETKRSGFTYTYETLLTLKSLYNGYELFFIVGMDCLFSIESWLHPEIIFSNCTLIVANRDHISNSLILEKKKELEDIYKAKIILLDYNILPVSSTQIRDMIYNNIAVEPYVPKSVLAYIKSHNLYKVGNTIEKQ